LGILDLTTQYTTQDYTDVSAKDGVYVDQTATNEYAIHQFKDYTGLSNSCTVEWYGKTNCPPSLSTVYLQIFNRSTPAWQTIATDSTTAEDTNFSLIAGIADLTNYKDANDVIVCRVYQLDV
jgi:hypothetical protein